MAFRPEQTIGSALGRLQAAMTDLSENGSKLRQELIARGMDPRIITQISQETNAIRPQNMARQLGLDIERARTLAEGRSPMAARGEANRAVRSHSVSMPSSHGSKGVAREPTASRAGEQSKEIEASSRKIAEQWAEIYEKVANIKDEFLAWGLPAVLASLTKINEGFGGILSTIKLIVNFGVELQIPLTPGQLYSPCRCLQYAEGQWQAQPAASPGRRGTDAASDPTARRWRWVMDAAGTSAMEYAASGASSNQLRRC